MTATPELPADLLDQLIDVGNKALNDYYHERACSCSQWPASCATGGDYRFGAWDTDAFAIGIPGILAAYEQAKAQQRAAAKEAGAAISNGIADMFLRLGSPTTQEQP